MKKGNKVRILVDTPMGVPLTGIVRVVQKDPGKSIGVELDAPVIGGHSLDGVIDRELVDPTTGFTVGRGWWTREENVEIV